MLARQGQSRQINQSLLHPTATYEEGQRLAIKRFGSKIGLVSLQVFQALGKYQEKESSNVGGFYSLSSQTCPLWIYGTITSAFGA